MPRTKEKSEFAVEVTKQYANGTVEVTLVIVDDGQLFHDATLRYYNVTQETDQLLENMLERAVGGQLPFSRTDLKQSEMEHIEDKIITVLDKLNLMSGKMRMLTKEEKLAAARKLLA